MADCYNTSYINDSGASYTGTDGWNLPADSGYYFDVGSYINCAVPKAWTTFQIILVAVAIIISMFLIYKTAMNRENSSVLEELAHQWPYTLLLAFVVIGGGGFLLNLFLAFFGLGNVQFWLDALSTFVNDTL